jgi:glycosyltransferase involved in cell wall biosynthesis
LNVGGPAQQALMLTQDLRPAFDTRLVAGWIGGGEAEIAHDPELVRRASLVRPVRPPTDARALGQLRKEIADFRPAIVHTHMAKAGLLGRLAATTSRVRPLTVHTFHGHVLRGYFGERAARGFLELERWLARRTDVLVAVSDEIRDELLDLGIGRADQYQVIPLGIDLAPFLAIEGPSGALRRHIGLEPDTPLVGALGRLVPIKDIGCLIEAVAALAGVHLAVIGDGESRADLGALAHRLAVSDRVHFAGWAPDVAAWLSDLDVLALTSVNEGTPLAAIEASATGIPVVATDVGGVRTVVRDELTGLLVGPDSPTAVARGIGALLDEPERRAELGAAGRIYVAERFDKRRLLSDIGQLYERLLATRRPS